MDDLGSSFNGNNTFVPEKMKKKSTRIGKKVIEMEETSDSDGISEKEIIQLNSIWLINNNIKQQKRCEQKQKKK